MSAGCTATGCTGPGGSALSRNRLEATCRPGNVASQRVLERVGFRQEGLLRGHVVVRGHRQDSLLYGLLAGRTARAATPPARQG